MVELDWGFGAEIQEFGTGLSYCPTGASHSLLASPVNINRGGFYAFIFTLLGYFLEPISFMAVSSFVVVHELR